VSWEASSREKRNAFGCGAGVIFTIRVFVSVGVMSGDTIEVSLSGKEVTAVTGVRIISVETVGDDILRGDIASVSPFSLMHPLETIRMLRTAIRSNNISGFLRFLIRYFPPGSKTG